MNGDYGTWTDRLGRDHQADVIARDGDRLVVVLDGQCPLPVDPAELH